jgi:hypothetical protein
VTGNLPRKRFGTDVGSGKLMTLRDNGPNKMSLITQSAIRIWKVKPVNSPPIDRTRVADHGPDPWVRCYIPSDRSHDYYHEYITRKDRHRLCGSCFYPAPCRRQCGSWPAFRLDDPFKGFREIFADQTCEVAEQGGCENAINALLDCQQGIQSLEVTNYLSIFIDKQAEDK